MNKPKDQELTVQDDIVVSMEYTLKVGGETVDHSEPDHPLQFIQGLGQVIPGLENALYDMQSGDSKSVVVSPEEGYGEEDDDAFAEVPRTEFPSDIPLERGTEVLLRDDEGEEQEAYIFEVDDNLVRLNLNHPLAGQELHFAITVVDLRMASDEELIHGHVHHN